MPACSGIGTKRSFPASLVGDCDCGFRAEIKFAVVLPEFDGAVSEWSDGERGGRRTPPAL